MEDSTHNQTNRQQVRDPLTELIREGTRQLIARAVEADLQLLLQQEFPAIDCKRSIIRNGYLPRRKIQTGAGEIIESTFAAVRLRTAKTRSCVSRSTILGMVFKFVQMHTTLRKDISTVT
ncbi:hypothetical protein [Desulfonatronospira sp.]|uniref:hypothetical protein n=1 Tax=Desulfonatronospira sp. TaxID=1962951 RepID=UPI0025C00F93|nr:hypothetical protein [Desulfonatronospira sp.]